MFKAIVSIAVIVGAWALWYYRFSYSAYLKAHYKAIEDDLAYFREHPDCTLEEAHRNRDRVNRRFGR